MGLRTRLNCKAIPFIGESPIEKPPSPNGRSILSRDADVALPKKGWIFNGPSRVQFGYGLSYLIDVEHAIIVDVEPTPARTYDEVA
jgi:hypothetical protein